MALSVRQRVLEIVTNHLRAQLVPAVARFVDQDLRGFSQVGSASCPCVFVTTAEAGIGETEHLPYQHVRERLGFSLIGYTVSSTGTQDGVMQAREEFLWYVMNALYRKNGDDQEVLLKALIDDAIAHGGNGAVDLCHSNPPDTDGGFVPPFGIFRVPCEATLHYQRDSF